MRLLFLFMLLAIIGCQSDVPEFKSIGNNAHYKLIQIGEGDISLDNEFTQLKVLVTSLTGDTLYYVPNYSYFIPNTNHQIDSIWLQFQQGDSIHLRIGRAQFNSYLKLFGIMQKNEGEIELRVRIEASLDSVEAAQRKQQMHSLRELEEQKKLVVYLNTFGDSLENLGGVYRKVGNRTTGDSIRVGSEVSIHYKGRFLDGYVFDDTYKKSITPSFTYGQEYQMIDGLQIALKGMKEGEKVKIILPSRHAFGEEGSLAGIVPPYTAVIYDIDIIKVLN